MRLTDRYPRRRAFITGAASGLGRALCRTLAADKWILGMADIDAEHLADAADEIRTLGGHPRIIDLDVREAEAFQQAADAFVADEQGIDLVVNNAGLGAGGAFEDTMPADWHAIVDVNLMGVVNGCHAFVPHLKDGGGHLVNIASIAAVAAAPRMSIYNTTKAGVMALSETLYSELHDAGVHVSVALPAFFETNIDQNMRGSEADRKITRRLIDRADTTADEVAQYILKKAGRDTIHIVYPRQAKLIWHWKRLFPTSYVKSMIKRFRSSIRFVEKLRHSE